MTILGVAEAVAAPLVRAITRDDLDRAELGERFARAAWSTIAEPGDGDAGVLIDTLGAEGALASVLAARDVDGVLAAIAEAGAETGVESAGPSREGLEIAIARWLPRLKADTVLLSLRQAARFGAGLLVPGDPAWPVGVDELGPHAPAALWVRGQAELLGELERAIAVVGARAATGYGEHVTVEAASGLVDRGFTIVSGAAYGIDGIAHRAALASAGSTVAFLAGGVDRFYPAGHEALLTRIVETGAVVSEVPCGTAPTKWRFLQRNRLIAAASRATIVVEAGWRSGSLNTAGHAAQLGRPLGAVPGPVTSAASAGCHRLLREYGATCVTTPDEMAELVPFDPPMALDQAPPDARGATVGADPEGFRLRVVDALSGSGGRSAERIAALSGLAVDRVRATLGLLELEGAAVERPSGWMRSRPKNDREGGAARALAR